MAADRRTLLTNQLAARVAGASHVVIALGTAGAAIGCDAVLGINGSAERVECTSDHDCVSGRCVDWTCVMPDGARPDDATAGANDVDTTADGSVVGNEHGLDASPDQSSAATTDVIADGAVTNPPADAGDGAITNPPADAGDGAVTADVRDARTDMAPGDAEAEVDEGQCEMDLFPIPPPAPCRGEFYSVRFGVLNGGKAPYVWTAESVPAGLTVSSEGQVAGTPTQAGPLKLTVTDATGRCSKTASYSIEPRDRCWLGYISTENGHPQLHLHDPIMADYSPSSARHTFPQSESVLGAVTDFQFSPDGRAVAYRLGTAPARLIHVRIGSWIETELDADGGSVIRYAWSSDSAALAYAFEKPIGDAGTSQYLRAVRWPPSQGGDAGDAGPKVLAAMPVTIESELTWIADDLAVAYHARVSDPTTQIVRTSRIGADAIEPEATEWWIQYSPSALFQRALAGFWAIDPTIPTTFWSVVAHPEEPALELAPHWHELVTSVAPSGRYGASVSAEADGGINLNVYRPEDETKSYASQSKCSKLLAWAWDRERLACVYYGEGKAGELRIVDIDPVSPNLSSSFVGGTYEYPEGSADGFRRAFSRNGSWFAFISRANGLLYIATLGDQNTPYISPSIPHQSKDSPDKVDLAFSPNARWLLEHRATELILHALDRDNPYALHISSELAAPSPCTEGYAAAPATWCGNSGLSKRLAWSPDSNWVAYRTDAGDLRLLAPPAPASPVFTTAQVNRPTCNSNCVSQYEFQP